MKHIPLYSELMAGRVIPPAGLRQLSPWTVLAALLTAYTIGYLLTK